ncbi:MAG: ATP-binding protein [bacterium]|nr:ATP-binding protein [bacterium]
MSRKLPFPLLSYGLFLAFIFVLLAPGFRNINNLFSTTGFDPHGHCFLWQPGILRLYVISDSLIGTSYVAIAGLLALLVYRARADIPFPGIFLMFGAFIISCGITHFMDVWTLWNPTYWVSGYAKFITAVASTATAIVMPPLIPRVLGIVDMARKSEDRRRQLVNANRELQAEIAERKRVEDELRTSEGRLKAVLKSVPMILWTVDQDGALSMLEGNALARVGVSQTDALGKPLKAVLSVEDVLTADVQTALSGTEQTAEGEINGVTFEMRQGPIYNAEGEIVGVIGVGMDITERRRAQAEILRMLEKERQLAELRSKILTTISHEIRTPLAIIGTSRDLLQRYSDRMTLEQRDGHLNKIRAQIDNILRLIDDMLILTRSARGELEFQPRTVSITSLCRSVAEDLNATLNGSGHRIVFSESPCLDPIVADEWLLRQMLMNLLGNAVKYSPDSTEVLFRVSCEADQVVLQVEDRGIGIPEAEQEHVFDVFYRAENVGALPGTGLGLTIVREAVKLHNGTVEIASEVNAGTTFTVRLPLRPAAPD